MALVGFRCLTNETVGRFRIRVKDRDRKVDFTRLPSIKSLPQKGMNRNMKVIWSDPQCISDPARAVHKLVTYFVTMLSSLYDYLVRSTIPYWTFFYLVFLWRKRKTCIVGWLLNPSVGKPSRQRTRGESGIHTSTCRLFRKRVFLVLFIDLLLRSSLLFSCVFHIYSY